MNSKTFKLLFICIGIVGTLNLTAGDSGCAKCQMIREYNAAHPQKEEFYEDYLEEHPNERAKVEQDAKVEQNQKGQQSD
jgi:hypothetical protein